MKNINEHALLLEAWLYEASHDYSGAERIYTNLLEISTKQENQASYLKDRGFARRCQKKYELALKDYDASITLNPQDNSLYWLKAAVCSTFASEVQHSREKKEALLEIAFECIEKSRKLEANEPLVWSDLIEQCLICGRYNQVVAYYGEARNICNNTDYQIINEWLIQIAWIFLKKPALIKFSDHKISNRIWSTVEVESFLLEKLDFQERESAEKAIQIHIDFLKNHIKGNNRFVYEPFHERFLA